MLQMVNVTKLYDRKKGGEVWGFDLLTLYKMHLRRGRCSFKTFKGSFSLSEEERVSLVSQYCNYYYGM